MKNVIDFLRDTIEARGGQLASRFVGVLFLCVAGWVVGEQSMIDDQTQSMIAQYAQAIGAAVAGFAAMLLDLWSHKRSAGGVLVKGTKPGKLPL